MNRRAFMKYFFILSAMGCIAGGVSDYLATRVRTFQIAGRIKKYPGKIKSMDSSVTSVGKWAG